jgi:hypothetical protein
MNTFALYAIGAPRLVSGLHESRVEELRQSWVGPIHLWPRLRTNVSRWLKRPGGVLRLAFGTSRVVRLGRHPWAERPAAMTAGSLRLGLLGR